MEICCHVVFQFYVSLFGCNVNIMYDWLFIPRNLHLWRRWWRRLLGRDPAYGALWLWVCLMLLSRVHWQCAVLYFEVDKCQTEVHERTFFVLEHETSCAMPSMLVRLASESTPLTLYPAMCALHMDVSDIVPQYSLKWSILFFCFPLRVYRVKTLKVACKLQQNQVVL